MSDARWKREYEAKSGDLARKERFPAEQNSSLGKEN